MVGLKPLIHDQLQQVHQCSTALPKRDAEVNKVKLASLVRCCFHLLSLSPLYATTPWHQTRLRS
jgi:hypothetical protein